MDQREHPRLRPVEAIPDPENGRVILRDPTQLAAGLLVVEATHLGFLALLDGTRRRLEIQGEYARRTGEILLSADLDGLLDQLETAGYLEGPGFEVYYEGLVREYRSNPVRPLRSPDGFGAPAAELPALLDGILAEAVARPTGMGVREYGGVGVSLTHSTPTLPHSHTPTLPHHPAPLSGIVVPHLDYSRGAPCYGDGYAALLHAERPRRVVVLGTNHFGRSSSVVATDRDFATPWGVVETDRDFLGRLQAETGGNLMPYELDHLREHSVELQALWLRHLFGEGVRIVPFLCPDPSGPDGTRPGDPDGVDLREFARALGDLVRRDPEPTLLIASADLSHVGGYFGDDRRLDSGFLDYVRDTDEAGLRLIDGNDAEGYREHMGRTGNPTRVCSVGCLYALMTALPDTAPLRLRYHQAVTKEIGNGVTCAAYAFYA
jgi:AmmeMemoRadiSam system protein B